MRVVALALLGFGMVLTAAGLPVVTAARAASPGPDAAAFVQLFATACAERSDYDALKASAVAAGWGPLDADAHTESVLDQTRALQKHVKSLGRVMTFEAYAKPGDDGGRYNLLVVSTLSRPGQPSRLDCNLYDFTASAPVDPALVEAALEVTAREHLDQGGASFDMWSLDGVPRRVMLGFVPPESEVAGTAGYSGAALTINTYATP